MIINPEYFDTYVKYLSHSEDLWIFRSKALFLIFIEMYHYEGYVDAKSPLKLWYRV